MTALTVVAFVAGIVVGVILTLVFLEAFWRAKHVGARHQRGRAAWGTEEVRSEARDGS